MGAFYAAMVLFSTQFGHVLYWQQETKLVQQQIFRSNTALRQEMNIYFPEVLGPAEVVHNANLGIQGIMAKAIAEFQNEALHYNEFSSMKMNYKLFYNHQDILSIHFSKNINLPGQPAKYIQHTFNYSFRQGKSIKFEDLFISYHALEKLITSKLQANAKFTRQSLEYFTFDQNGVYFCFNNGFLGVENCPEMLKLDWQQLNGSLKRGFSSFSK